MSERRNAQQFLSTVSPSWPGFTGIKNLVVFGDSYSDILFKSGEHVPSPSEPLGIAFPGKTFTESGDLPNWVGYVVERRNANDMPLLVYDYAVGGARVVEVADQIHDHFIPTIGHKPNWAPWDSQNTLFATWVGINDCGWQTTHKTDVQELFALQEELYQLGARNFMFIDVPPINRAPAYTMRGLAETEGEPTYLNWNMHLHLDAQVFHDKHPDVTILMFSSWDTFSRILDDPVGHGFEKSDAKQFAGRIWMDHLHPTSKIHELVADDIGSFLNDIPAYSPNE